MPRRRPPAAALVSSVEEIEAQFYEALQQGDIEKLMAVWADEEEIVCVHPGGPRIVGLAAIRATFEAIFGNGVVPVRVEKVRRVESAGLAMHNVLERVDVTAEDGREAAAWVIATNVYVKSALGWRMVAHHASPGSSVEPPEISEAPSVLH